MAEPQVFWRRDDEQDRKRFALLLAPLVGASRTKSFTRHEGTAYILSMQDVPPAILEAAVEELVRDGVTWMPKPGELKVACAKVIERRRIEAYRDSLPAECPVCHHEKAYTGARWKTVTVNGGERLTPCDCRLVAIDAMNRVGQPIALPPSREDQMELGS